MALTCWSSQSVSFFLSVSRFIRRSNPSLDLLTVLLSSFLPSFLLSFLLSSRCFFPSSTSSSTASLLLALSSCFLPPFPPSLSTMPPRPSLVALNASLATLTYVLYSGYAYRPQCDLSPCPDSHPKGNKGPTWGGTPGWNWKTPTVLETSLHTSSTMPHRSLSDDATLPAPLGLLASRYLTVAVVDRVIATLMFYYSNAFSIVGSSDNHSSLLSLILAKDPEVTVLTVSNHCCTLDDPILFGKLLPPFTSASFNNQRWSLCSQEVCFKNPALSTFFGAGKVLPIKRGAGIDQRHLLDFSRKAAKGGQWLHLFPEGKIYQSGTLGADYYLARSDKRAASIGRMKWGTGKVVAHCPKKLVVVPFHHAGMEGVIPQYATGQLKTVMPVGPNTATLRVGVPLTFGDLVADHERVHGPLWKYEVRRREGEPWVSSPAEKVLYSQISLRIEIAIKALEMESKEDSSESVRESRRGIARNLATVQDGFMAAEREEEKKRRKEGKKGEGGG